MYSWLRSRSRRRSRTCRECRQNTLSLHPPPPRHTPLQYHTSNPPSRRFPLEKENAQSTAGMLLRFPGRHRYWQDTDCTLPPLLCSGLTCNLGFARDAGPTQLTFESSIARTGAWAGGGGRGVGIVWTVCAGQNRIVDHVFVCARGACRARPEVFVDIPPVAHTRVQRQGGCRGLRVHVARHTPRLSSDVLVRVWWAGCALWSRQSVIRLVVSGVTEAKLARGC